MDTTQSSPRAAEIPTDEDRLGRALRLVASQASAITRGGAALVYTRASADSATGRLRAAAGFRSTDEARQVTSGLHSIVGDAFASAEPQTGDPLPALDERGAGGTLALPMISRDQTLGVLVVASENALPSEARESIETLAWSAATQLHATLALQYENLVSESEKHLEFADEKSDELLKLSEELFAQDIELLRNNEKLGKIEKLKNDFIEKMSRELRTPLNSIIEATITVLAGENENLSDASQQSLRNALDEGTAFQRTLQNILDLWRIKQDELPIETQELSFADVIDETIFSVQDTLGDKPVEIVKEIPAPLPKIRGDLTKINQILFLLLDNAAKFTQEGTITIGARYCDDRLFCSIQDTGIGICPDDQKYIWNEFYQVDDRASIRYRGAGLGLTLVHDLLVLLGGDSMLESEPGTGTRVEFSVPVVPA
jgi:signal transduction histidine kinase